MCVRMPKPRAPRFRVIRWSSSRVSAPRNFDGFRLHYCPPIQDVLHWGPQHVDLATQRLLRRCYHRGLLDDETDFAAYVQALEGPDEVLFWGEPSLGSCLAILWTLDVLYSSGAKLERASLALLPVRADNLRSDLEAVHQIICGRIPVQEVLEPLLAVRRHLASDSDQVRADLSRLPPNVRDWAAVSNLMEEFLPDHRGLDIIDSLILDALTNGGGRRCWLHAVEVLGEVLRKLHQDPEDPHYARGHDIGDLWLWDRLLELNGALHPPWRAKPLVEARCEGALRPHSTWFRLGLRGQRVGAGQGDALTNCGLERWVGGRLVTAKRPLRRPQ
jgi:hypothetical protein